MLLRPETLTPAARDAWGLERDPFNDEIHTRADVWASKAVRYTRAALLDCALNHGFKAIVGESGAGKSVLAAELEQRIADEGRPVRMIRPYVLATEDSEAKGKPMLSTHIAAAVMRTLAPNAPKKSDPDSRFAQVHDTLRHSRQAGYSNLIVIEEAHCLPRSTLRHLKRYLELTQGFSRLVGVALIAQPELLVKLSDQSPDMREVVQRCEVVQLPAMDDELEAYVAHKLQRAGKAVGDVLAPDVCDAIRKRLVRMPRGGKAADAISVCHPLAVNNLLVRAMNAAAAVGMPKVDASVIAGC